MNRTYRHVFNRRRQIWQVASELSRGSGKTGRALASLAMVPLLMLLPGLSVAQTTIIDGNSTVPGSIPDGYNFGALFVGLTADGTLSISGGANVSSTSASIGNNVGNGSVTVSGSGTVWSNGSTLRIGSNATTGILTIEDGGTVRTGTISLISGSSVLNLLGGVLEITSLDPGIGTLNWNGGILRATADNANFLTTSNINLNFGIALLDTNGHNVGLGNLQSPSSWFTKQGTGTLTVNQSLWMATTTVSAGTLQIGNGLGNATLTGNVAVNSGATLAFNNNSANFYGNVISGTGNLVKLGIGTLTLTGSNNYSGGTTISAGTLQIGNGGAAGAITGNATIASGASLAFNRNNNLTYGGVIDGLGNVSQAGTGTTILSGNNTYSGGTTISAGTLQIGNGGAAGAITGNATIASGASLAFNRSDDTSFSGVISGAGSLLKQGAGALTLTGTSNYTGGTSINAGTLRIAGGGSLVSAATVNSGATLAGSGSVGSATVMAGGTVHAETGTLSVNGNYTQAANGTLRVDATDAANYSRLAVTGNASFAAGTGLDVNVSNVNTLGIGNTLSSVISAGTLQASTFNVTDNSALFNFRAFVNGNNVDLKVVANSNTGMQNAVSGQQIWSALGAASVLDGQIMQGAGGDMGTVVNALGQLASNRDVARAAAQTLPVISGNQAIQGTLSGFQSLIQQRNGDPARATGVASGERLADGQVWGKIFGSRATQDDRSGAAGFKADSWGMAFGSGMQVTPDARLGVAYGYAKTSVNGNTDLAGTAQRADINSHVISVYGSKDLDDNRTFTFQGDAGLNNSKSTRQLAFGGLARTASADYRTYSAHLGAALAQAFALSENTTLIPAIRADYTWLKSPGHDETGAGALNLSVATQRTDALVLGADALLQHRFANKSRLDVRVGAGYDAINDRGNIIAAYAGAPGQSFVTTGIDHSPWLVHGSIGYSMTAANGVDITLRYDAEGRSGYLNHTASVRANWAF